MNWSFRDSTHLIRPALILVAGVGILLLVRSAVLPKAFGQYGHFRPAALDINRGRPLVFAGQKECVLCHDEEAKARAAGKHALVSCEACHGPQANHASDPGQPKPALPDVRLLCARCHEKDAAIPKAFP